MNLRRINSDRLKLILNKERTLSLRDIIRKIKAFEAFRKDAIIKFKFCESEYFLHIKADNLPNYFFLKFSYSDVAFQKDCEDNDEKTFYVYLSDFYNYLLDYNDSNGSWKDFYLALLFNEDESNLIAGKEFFQHEGEEDIFYMETKCCCPFIEVEEELFNIDQNVKFIWDAKLISVDFYKAKNFLVNIFMKNLLKKSIKLNFFVKNEKEKSYLGMLISDEEAELTIRFNFFEHESDQSQQQDSDSEEYSNNNRNQSANKQKEISPENIEELINIYQEARIDLFSYPLKHIFNFMTNFQSEDKVIRISFGTNGEIKLLINLPKSENNTITYLFPCLVNEE